MVGQVGWLSSSVVENHDARNEEKKKKKKKKKKRKMDKGGVFEQGGWRIEVVKGPIMTTAEMEAFEKAHDMPSLPEMIHGSSVVAFSRGRQRVSFSAKDALVEWRRTCLGKAGPKVANAGAWREERGAVLADIPVAEYDWTFHSGYAGTVEGGVLEESERGIPYEKLQVREEILFWDQLVLMEDELADNGVCIETVKLRVMKSGFFCLHRLLLRVDDVVATIHDTRLYHEFGSDRLFHEFSVRSSTYEQLRKAGTLPSDPSLFSDDNFLYGILDKVSLETKILRIDQ